MATCPISLPQVGGSAAGTPVLLDFLPLAGPFGAEALAFLPLAGPALTLIAPLLPALNPTLTGAQPAIAAAVSGAVLVEQVVLGPFGPEITSFTPQAVAGEKEVIALLQPVTTATTHSPAVACVYDLTSAVGALLVRGKAGGALEGAGLEGAALEGAAPHGSAPHGSAPERRTG